MIINKKGLKAIALVMGTAAIPATVHATNGINLMGYGAKSAAMGGVGIGGTVDAITASVMNPAAASFTEDRFDIGLLVLNPQRRAACCGAPNGEVSDKNWFFIPNMGITHKYSDDISFAASFVGKGGGRTEYKFNFFNPGDPGVLGIELAIGEMVGAISYKIQPNQSVALGLVFAAQRFRAKGLEPFRSFSKAPGSLTGNGFDWSYGGGLRLGWQGKFMNDDLSFGAAYTTTRYMTKFDKYKGLFADDGGFDLPADIGLGVAYKAMDNLTLSFDWQRVFYSDLKSVGNATLPISAASNSPNNLGEPGGPGFGWEDQDVFKLGLQYDANEKWTLMSGINYGASPINDTDGGGELEFNVLAPATTEWHAAIGGTYKLDDEMELTGTFWHAFLNKQDQFIPVGTGLPFEGETVEIEMRQYGWEVGFAYKF